MAETSATTRPTVWLCRLCRLCADSLGVSAQRRADVDHALVLDRHERGAERHDHPFDARVHVVAVAGVHLDVDLADGLRVEACLLELLQEPVAVGDPRRMHVDVIRHWRRTLIAMVRPWLPRRRTTASGSAASTRRAPRLGS